VKPYKTVVYSRNRFGIKAGGGETTKSVVFEHGGETLNSLVHNWKLGGHQLQKQHFLLQSEKERSKLTREGKKQKGGGSNIR